MGRAISFLILKGIRTFHAGLRPSVVYITICRYRLSLYVAENRMDGCRRQWIRGVEKWKTLLKSGNRLGETDGNPLLIVDFLKMKAL